MNDPHAGEIPFFPDTLQTVFFTEGTTVAIVITNKQGRMSERTEQISSAEDALAWAKKHQARMVYLPVAPEITGN